MSAAVAEPSARVLIAAERRPTPRPYRAAAAKDDRAEHGGAVPLRSGGASRDGRVPTLGVGTLTEEEEAT